MRSATRLRLESAVPATPAAPRRGRTLPLDALGSGDATLAPPVSVELGARERELLRSLTVGGAVDEIAAASGLDPGELRNRVAALYRRLGVRDRTEAIAAAIQLGLVDGYAANGLRRPWN